MKNAVEWKNNEEPSNGVEIMKTILQQISSFVLNTRFEDLPAEVVKTAKLGLTDFFACCLAGNASPVCQDITTYLSKVSLGNKDCVLIGTSRYADYSGACMFNGVSSHCMDFDDVSWATIGHPSVSVSPACFASAQENRWDGKQLILSYVLAVEAMHRIAKYTMPQVSERGWHTTLAYGVFGAAVCGALKYGLNETQLVNALAIAASRAGGIRANFGTQTKALHAGLSNKIGVDCALLASCGVTGSSTAIEGQDGYAQCFGGLTIDNSFEDKNYWDLLENGLVIKRYPCCSGTHPTNDVLDEYLDTHSLSSDDIVSIETGVSLLGPKELTCHLPQNAIQAKFSLEFAIAYRILKGKLSLSSFRDEVVLDPEVQKLMKKVEMKVSPELEKLGFIGTAPIRMKIHLKDDNVIQLSNDLAKGNPEKPLSQEEFFNKFLDCSSKSVSKEKAQDWFELLINLEKAQSEELSTLGLSEAR